METPDDPARAFTHPVLDARPMHACSCCKAIAGFAEPAFQNVILSDGVKRRTEHMKITEAELRAEFAGVVQCGFSDRDHEIDIGIASVAAPISIGNIGAMFRVGAVGPIRRIGSSNRRSNRARLARLAKNIS